jgi:hypothetical protein
MGTDGMFTGFCELEMGYVPSVPEFPEFPPSFPASLLGAR